MAGSTANGRYFYAEGPSRTTQGDILLSGHCSEPSTLLRTLPSDAFSLSSSSSSLSFSRSRVRLAVGASPPLVSTHDGATLELHDAAAGGAPLHCFHLAETETAASVSASSGLRLLAAVPLPNARLAGVLLADGMMAMNGAAADMALDGGVATIVVLCDAVSGQQAAGLARSLPAVAVAAEAIDVSSCAGLRARGFGGESGLGGCLAVGTAEGGVALLQLPERGQMPAEEQVAWSPGMAAPPMAVLTSEERGSSSQAFCVVAQQGPNGTNRNAVTAITLVPDAELLLAGHENGAVTIWSCSRLSEPLLTLPAHPREMEVTHLGYHGIPSDQAGTAAYLWCCFRDRNLQRPARLQMHMLSVDVRESGAVSSVNGDGAPCFTHDLGGCSPRAVRAYSVCLSLATCEVSEDGELVPIVICLWQSSGEKGEPKTMAAVFDPDRWLSEHQPLSVEPAGRAGRTRYFSAYDVLADHDDAAQPGSDDAHLCLAGAIDVGSVRRYSSRLMAGRPERDAESVPDWIASVSFSASLVLDNDTVVEVTFLGAQEEALAELSLGSLHRVVEPVATYQRCQDAGLVSHKHEVPDVHAARRALLDVALNNGMAGVISAYIRHIHATGHLSVTSAELDSMSDLRLWLDAVLQRARHGRKRALDELAAGNLGSNELSPPLFLYASLLAVFQALLQIQSSTAGLTTELGWATLVRQWASLQAENLQLRVTGWLCHRKLGSGVLWGVPSGENAAGTLLQLLLDHLDSGLHAPPTSAAALVALAMPLSERSFLRLTASILCHVDASLVAVDASLVADFAHTFGLSATQLDAALAMHAFDVGDRRRGVNLLAALPQPVVPGQHALVLDWLLQEGLCEDALSYWRAQQADIERAGELHWTQRVLLANKAVTLCFDALRSADAPPAVFSKFFRQCVEDQLSKQLLQLPLDREEQQIFEESLCDGEQPRYLEVLVGYYLQKGQIAAAYAVHCDLEARPHHKDERRSRLRKALLDNYLLALAPAQRVLLQEGRGGTAAPGLIRRQKQHAAAATASPSLSLTHKGGQKPLLLQLKAHAATSGGIMRIVADNIDGAAEEWGKSDAAAAPEDGLAGTAQAFLGPPVTPSRSSTLHRRGSVSRLQRSLQRGPSGVSGDATLNASVTLGSPFALLSPIDRRAFILDSESMPGSALATPTFSLAAKPATRSILKKSGSTRRHTGHVHLPKMDMPAAPDFSQAAAATSPEKPHVVAVATEAEEVEDEEGDGGMDVDKAEVVPEVVQMEAAEAEEAMDEEEDENEEEEEDDEITFNPGSKSLVAAASKADRAAPNLLLATPPRIERRRRRNVSKPAASQASPSPLAAGVGPPASEPSPSAVPAPVPAAAEPPTAGSVARSRLGASTQPARPSPLSRSTLAPAPLGRSPAGGAPVVPSASSALTPVAGLAVSPSSKSVRVQLDRSAGNSPLLSGRPSIHVASPRGTPQSLAKSAAPSPHTPRQAGSAAGSPRSLPQSGTSHALRRSEAGSVASPAPEAHGADEAGAPPPSSPRRVTRPPVQPATLDAAGSGSPLTPSSPSRLKAARSRASPAWAGSAGPSPMAFPSSPGLGGPDSPMSTRHSTPRSVAQTEAQSTPQTPSTSDMEPPLTRSSSRLGSRRKAAAKASLTIKALVQPRRRSTSPDHTSDSPVMALIADDGAAQQSATPVRKTRAKPPPRKKVARTKTQSAPARAGEARTAAEPPAHRTRLRTRSSTHR